MHRKRPSRARVCGLERETRLRDADALMREMRAIGERCAARLKPGPSAIEHGDYLYDEQGLPK